MPISKFDIVIHPNNSDYIGCVFKLDRAFAWVYVVHPDRITTDCIRRDISLSSQYRAIANNRRAEFRRKYMEVAKKTIMPMFIDKVKKE